MTPAEAIAVVDSMKARGVRSFKLDALEVVFLPAEGPPLKSDGKPLQLDTCVCGHGLHAHQGGLCLLGCEPEKCTPAGAS